MLVTPEQDPIVTLDGTLAISKLKFVAAHSPEDAVLSRIADRTDLFCRIPTSEPQEAWSNSHFSLIPNAPKMAEIVSLQTDVGYLPMNVFATANFTHTLPKAVSADDVNPLTVLQVQSLGCCFHSNGPWAEKLPDPLGRTA